MICFHPENRITISEILEHPWMSENLDKDGKNHINQIMNKQDESVLSDTGSTTESCNTKTISTCESKPTLGKR